MSNAHAIDTDARELTPELADLMEHEKVIEQGLAGFIEVGNALIAIKQGKKYRAAGYATFEDYCQRRWSMSGRRGKQLVDAAQAVEEIGTTVQIPPPTNEAQVRPLTSLPTPEQKAEAWELAVEHAGGEQPTAKDVEAAVAAVKPTPQPVAPEPRPVAAPVHPATFSADILDVIASHVVGLDRVLDPFAGVGTIHKLRGLAGVRETVGVELEPEWATLDQRTIVGDATALPFPDGSFDAVATSPTYGNRMADHHEARDDSIRLTYTHRLGRPLTDGSSASMQWGDAYRDLHERAWIEAARVLRPGGLLIVNIKDHVRDGEIQHVTAWHVDFVCRDLGLQLVAQHCIPTKGLPAGENAATRVPCEQVFVFRKTGS